MFLLILLIIDNLIQDDDQSKNKGMILSIDNLDAIGVGEGEDLFAHVRHRLAVLQQAELVGKYIDTFELIVTMHRFDLELGMKKGEFLFDLCQLSIRIFWSSGQEVERWMEMEHFLMNFDQCTREESIRSMSTKRCS